MTSAKENQISDTQPKTLPAQMLELLSKGVAAAAVAIYVCGFLVISINYSRYGVLETNPFRTRILAAGAWFILFTIIPVSIILAYERSRPIAWVRLSRYLYPYYIACMGLGIMSQFVLQFSERVPQKGATVHWWIILVYLVPLMVLVFLMEAKGFLR